MSIVIIISFTVFFAMSFYQTEHIHKDFVEQEYSGIIKEVKYIKGNRGMPSIKINTFWIHLGPYSSKISHYIQTGDSIVKKKGYEEIIIFRRNKNGEWVKKVFK